MKWTRSLGGALLGALLSAAPTAQAHDNWIELDPFMAPAPTRTKVYLLTGEAFREAQPLLIRRRERYTRLQLLGAAGKQDLTKSLLEDQQPLAVVDPGKAPGSFLLSLDSTPRTIQIEAKKFQEYLLEERLVDILVYRAAFGKEDEPGRERYTRYLKALLQIGSKLDPLVTQPVGEDLEIVPLAHPYGLAPGAPLTVQVLFHGKPLAGRAIFAASRHRSDVTSKTLRTDASGKATFTIGRAGDWMFGLVHMEPSTEPDVDWRSYWASLTFSLPEPAAVP